MKKKLLAAVLSGVMFLGLMCGCKKPKVYGEEIPVYTSDKEFHIGMWVGIPSRIGGKELTDEEFENQFKLIKEAGFSMAEGGYGEVSVEYNKRALAAAEKAGVGMRVYDPDIISVLLNNSLDEEDAEVRLRQFSARYTGYKSFTGLKICDEPSYKQIAGFKTAKTRFDKVFGDRMFAFNLLPAVAGPATVTSDYREYIREYVRQINTPYVSYDHYVLVRDIKGNPTTLSTFLYNMEAVKMAAPDKDMYTFLQSVEHGNCRELTSVADATFQTYSFLAYGGAGIEWFCYGPLPENDGATNFEEACISRKDGKPTPTYDYVKTANSEIRSFEHIYHNFDWKGVMTTIGTENENGGENANFNMLSDSLIASHERIRSLKTSEDTLTGVFKDAEGRDGFMVVNFTEPAEKKKNKVEFVFENSSRAIVIKKGVQEVVDTDGGKLSFTMNEGEGYFVIPLK